MKKLILALLTVTTMAFFMTACGSDSSKDAGTDGAATETAKTAETDGSEAEPTAEGDNTLTVWCWDPAFNIYAMEQAAEVYKQTNPDFVLNVIETPWEDIQTKLTTAATSDSLDTLPDIMLIQDNAFQKNVISYPDAFTDITNSGIDFSQFGESKVAYSTVEGKKYGVPFDNGAVIGAYRTDVLEEAGFTIDDFTDITFDKYIEQGKVVLEKTGKPLLSCMSGESDVIMMMLQSAGGSLFDTEGNPTMIDNAILKNVMETYVEMIKSGVLVEVNDWDQYVGTLTNGTVAGTINGCWIMASIQTAQDQAGNWGITNMPALDGIDTATNYSNNGGSSWAITSNTKNAELAYDFMASTFAGSVEFYETILPQSGALATYLPAGESEVYAQPQDFFGGEPVFSTITEFAGKIPSNNTGVYYYEARDAVATAITNVVGGSDIDAELKNAEDTVNFAMGK